MIEISKKSNLLEQKSYRYQLQDIDEPNLYREIYTYTEIPKVPFNHRRVPLGMPHEIWITDTSFRDGMQSQAPSSPKQIVDLYKLLNKLGGPNGIIRATEFFVYSENDRKALHDCQELGLEFPEITTWIRASLEDFKLVKDLGIKETGILVSCSDYHIFKKLGMSRGQAMDHYLKTIHAALEMGIRPRCHFEDITRADFYGFVVPFVNAIQAMSREAGIPSRSELVILWVTAFLTVKSRFLEAFPVSSTVCSTIPMFRANSLNGMDITISTRALQTLPALGSSVLARSTARCSA